MAQKRKSESPISLPEVILTLVCQHFDILEEEIFVKSRKRRLVYIRHVLYHLIRKFTTKPLERIGKFKDNRNHATVLHGVNTISNLMDVDKKVKEEVEYLESKCDLIKNSKSKTLLNRKLQIYKAIRMAQTDEELTYALISLV